MKLLCVFFLICISTSFATPSTLKNVDYLGSGYNILKGNPHEIGTGLIGDRGFANHIVNFSYIQSQISADENWKIPDNVQLYQDLACSFSISSYTVAGSQSYQDTLSVDASLDTSASFVVWNAKFSASASYQALQSGNLASKNVYVESSGLCNQYTVKLQSNFQVTPAFLNDVKNMLLRATTIQPYYQFLDRYGTHYLTEATMGSKFIMRNQFTQLNWATFQQSNISLSVAASVQFMSVTGSASNLYNTQQQQQSQAFQSLSTQTYAYIGSYPPSDGSTATWAQSTAANPYPVQFKLSEITNLFDENFLTGLSPSSIGSMKSKLITALQNYCSKINGCGAPGQDSIPVSIYLESAKITGGSINTGSQISCRAGYSLLSCGMNNKQSLVGSGDFERFRHSFPISSTTCKSYDFYGATSVAQCINSASIKGFQIQQAHGSGGNEFSVSCPTGTKVLGCHIKPDYSTSNYEVWRRYYPSYDGTKCNCYDYFGATCYATCGSNILNHQVVSSGDNGTFSANCPANTFVLGCGIYPDIGVGPENWRRVAVDSLTSCNCYDNYKATCFAICGQFS